MVSHIEDGETFELVKVGVPRDPTEFITAAVTLGHPRFLLARVSGEAEVAVDHLLGNAAELSLYRARFLKDGCKEPKSYINTRRICTPSCLHTCAGSLRANAFCCWREMLLELGYKDAKVIDEIIRGSPMTGGTEESGVFEPDVRPPDMTVDQLRGIAMAEPCSGWLIGASRCIRAGWPGLGGNQAEIQNRWLEPFEVSYLRLVDELTATILVMLRKCSDSALPNLVGRTFDLKSAYKQFGVDVEHQKLLGLPSGTRTAELSSLRYNLCHSEQQPVFFLSIAASIKFIGTVGCGSFGPIL